MIWFPLPLLDYRKDINLDLGLEVRQESQGIGSLKWQLPTIPGPCRPPPVPCLALSRPLHSVLRSKDRDLYVGMLGVE